MGDLLFIGGTIFCVGWVVGYLGYNADGIFHLMLIAAFVLLLLSSATSNKTL
jgi:hypothetical protein